MVITRCTLESQGPTDPGRKQMTTAQNTDVLRPDSQVTITGRNVEVPEHFAERVNTKLAKIEKLDPTLTFFHVELQHEIGRASCRERV